MARMLTLLAIYSVLALIIAPGVYATESSVDAYAGEALVLGQPTHHAHRGAQGKGSQIRGAASASRRNERTPTAVGSGASAGGGGPSGGSASGTGGSGANNPSSGAAGNSGGGVHASGKGSSAGSAKRPSVGVAKSAPVPSIYPTAAAGGASLSVLDVLLILVGISLLATIALLLRRVAHTAE